MKNINMKEKIIDFVRYHNAFVVVMVLAMVGVGSVFANEDIRDAVVGEEIITETGVDNSQLLSADLHNFDVGLTINYVSEDEKSYYIDYSFSTIAVQDNTWKPIVKLEKFTVNKEGLGNRDLGLYLTEELGEVANSEIIYLKEAQKTEKERGETKIVKTIEYSGLIGLVLDAKNNILPGYEPVVQPEIVVENYTAAVVPVVPSPAPAAPPAPVEPIEPIEPPASIEPVEPEQIFGCMDSTATNYNPSATQDNESCVYPAPASADVCDAEHLNLCLAESDCLDVSGFWYDDVCNLAESSADESEPACDAEHLELCVSQELCETAELYWYNDVCNLQAEAPVDVCDADNLDLCNNLDLCAGIGLYWYNEICNLETEVILGCIDETALNYNPEATEDDGTCQYPAPTCESFTYSDWGECQADGTHARTVLTSLPDGCVDGDPILSQTCDYEPEPEPEE